MSGPKVALTRSAADNQTLAAALVSAGISVVEIPMIEIAFSDEAAVELHQCMADFDTFQWLVFTSANGVHAFAAAFDSYNEVGEPLTVDDGLRVAVVGPATRSALADSSVWPRILRAARSDGQSELGSKLAAGDDSGRLFMPPIGTATNLVENFPDPLTGGDRVLAVLSHLADGTITDGLGDKGYVVRRVNGYRNIRPERTAEASSFDIAVFFSPSAVDRFCDLYGNDCSAVCIGPRTSHQATVRGLSVLATADPHTEAGVLEQLLTLFG